jgi:hypothetical protein
MSDRTASIAARDIARPERNPSEPLANSSLPFAHRSGKITKSGDTKGSAVAAGIKPPGVR